VGVNRRLADAIDDLAVGADILLVTRPLFPANLDILKEIESALKKVGMDQALSADGARLVEASLLRVHQALERDARPPDK
jgi:hypothetical protein